MSWVTIIWSMVASACLTLAFIHGLVWWGRREALGNLLFAITAAATAALAGSELWMMRAASPEQLGAALRWAHLPAWLIIVALVGFMRLHLRAGHSWLSWTVCALRTLSLVLNFVFSPNLNYREIAGLRHVWFLGEWVAVADGTPSPWMVVGNASLILLMIFVVDAAAKVWRRGMRLSAIFTGLGVVFFVLAGSIQSIMALWGLVHMPPIPSLFYLGIVAGMAWQLSDEVVQSGKLISERKGREEALRESEARFGAIANAAPVMIWISGPDKLCTFFNNGWLGFTGRTLEQEAGNGWAQGVHPEDLERCLEVYVNCFDARKPFSMEYRLRRRDGEYRWLLDIGTPHISPDASFLGYIGSCIDITERKYAEDAAYDLSGRLIRAQEEAQKQLARDLHDDIGQTLALLSIDLDMFGRDLPPEQLEIAARIEDISTRLKAISSDVHQLSHDLHPAKLEQLGLVAAVRGFCKEFGAAHEMAIEFAEHNVPYKVRDAAALCSYRIAQEALQNAVKHSRGTVARVELVTEAGHLRLVVMDDGAGFDPEAARAKGTLGLISMSERVRHAGGQLRIESRPGRGTRVEVRLPIGEPDLHLASHRENGRIAAL